MVGSNIYMFCIYIFFRLFFFFFFLHRIFNVLMSCLDRYNDICMSAFFGGSERSRAVRRDGTSVIDSRNLQPSQI